ncbi:influenza virus NS1A-binding protein-like [Oratosquilla oratoria]|uniref:influenza virus NS1A-binding protein-like n=1 Tax=Oratosquilla oratoria TaxID=337810 RepID=UPI003F76B73C
MVTEARLEGLVLEDSASDLHQRLVQLNQLRKNRHFCDVVLQVGSSELHAHRSVLACSSPYFFELFTAEDEQKTQREGKVTYKLNGGCFEREAVDVLITYSYTGQLRVLPDHVKSVYIAANRLKMETAARKCGEYLAAHLSPETCLAIRAIPGIASNKQLVKQIDNFIQQQHDLLLVTRDTKGVVKLQLTVMVSKDDAAVTGRALSLLALDWIKKQLTEEDLLLESLKEKKHLLYLSSDNSLHDCADIQNGDANDSEIVQDYKKLSRKMSQPNIKVRRKSSATHPVKPRMMLYSRSISDQEDAESDVDWKLITWAHVSESSVMAIVTLKGQVAVVSIHQRLHTSSPTPTPQPSRPCSMEKVDCYTVVPYMASPKCGTGTGNFNGVLLVSGGYDRGECLRVVEAYNPKTNTWTAYPAMRQGRGRFDLTVMDGRAYAVGGCDGSRELNTVEVLDPNLMKWTSAAPLPLARSNTGVCNLGGHVYCVGGWNGQYGIKQCDVLRDDGWKTIAPLHVGRYQAGVAALDGKVYAVGGCDSWNCLNTVESYDPHTNIWKFAAPLATQRRGCGAAVLNGKLYVVGGSDGTQSLCTTEIYDPESNTWSSGPPMTSCRANVGVAEVDGKIYAVGGFSGKTFLNSIEYLDPDTNEWTNFTPKPNSPYPGGTASLNGHSVSIHPSSGSEGDVSSRCSSLENIDEAVIEEGDIDSGNESAPFSISSNVPLTINGH